MDRFKLVHPFLFAIIPILFLYGPNSNSTPLGEILRPTLVVTAVTLAALIGLASLLKDGPKAAIVVTMFWVLFFAYGYLLTTVKAMDRVVTSAWRLFWHPALPILLFALFSVVAFRVVRSRYTKGLANLAGFAGLCLVALQLVEVVQVRLTGPEVFENAPIQSNAIPMRKPHIFYIILDAYGRSDVLKELYQFDNSSFLEHLKQKRFYIASESRSNYSQTYLSLASSLNLDYLDDTARRVGSESNQTSVLGGLIQRSQLASFLRSQGYRFISFSSGVSFTEIRNAEVFVNRLRFLNQFEYVFLQTTPIGQFTETGRFQESLHRQRLSHIFAHLPDYASSRTPVFVFAHILAPHEPFVFGEAGEAVDDTGGGGMSALGPGLDYVAKYRRQVQFVTKRIERTIDEILVQSSEPPIIVLQSDHGPAQRPLGEFGNLHERMSILHASHLPEGGNAFLYPGITPVNTFRIILKHYFHADLPLLEDKSFFSTYDRPFRFVDVTNRIKVSRIATDVEMRSMPASTIGRACAASQVRPTGLKPHIGFSRMPVSTPRFTCHLHWNHR
jgi:hypothetical protein